MVSSAEIGAPAPPLKIRKFVKGTPAKKTSKIRLLHFWTTQCRPCDNAIPVINRIAKDFAKEVEVLAIGSNAPEVIANAPELKKMQFTVAADDELRTIESYLRSYDKYPTDAIVGRDGKLLWLGPSAAMPEILKSVVDGKYNLTAAAELDKFNRSMEKAAAVNDYKGALKLMDVRLKKHPHDTELIAMRAELLSRRLDSPAQAIASLTEAIAKYPRDFKLHETRIQLLGEQKATGSILKNAYSELAVNFTHRPAIPVQIAENMLRRPIGQGEYLYCAYILAHSARYKGTFRSNGEKGKASLVLARCYYTLGLTDQAIALAKESMVLLSGTPDGKRAENDLKFYHNVKLAGEQVKAEEK